MTLVKHNFRNLDNLFEGFLGQFPVGFEKNWETNLPPVNIHETNDAFHLELVAPGLKKEDFKISLEKGLLTISYEKKEEKETNDYQTHRREYVVKSFKRSFTIEDKIEESQVAAKYENGILQLLLPKKEEVKVSPREITIQ